MPAAPPRPPPARSEMLWCQLGTWSRPPLRPVTLTHEGRSGEASPAPPKDGAVATAAEKEAGPRLGRRLRGLLPTRSGSRSDSCVLTHLPPACAPRPGLLPSQGVWTTGPVSECCAFTRKSCGPCSPRRPLANYSAPPPTLALGLTPLQHVFWAIIPQISQRRGGAKEQQSRVDWATRVRLNPNTVFIALAVANDPSHTPYTPTHMHTRTHTTHVHTSHGYTTCTHTTHAHTHIYMCTPKHTHMYTHIPHM